MPLKTTPLFRATRGLITAVDAEELPHDIETGEIGLQIAVNAVVSISGKRISRRSGYSKNIAGSFHSGFRDRTDTLCIQEFPGWASLMRYVPETTSLTGVRSGLTKFARMSYVEIGDSIFYSNGFESGVYSGGVSSAWTLGEYVGYRRNDELTSPPTGGHMAALGGWLLIAKSVLWHSEPGNPYAFNLADNYIDFEEDPTMVRVVADGIWVGTKHRSYHLVGHDPNTLKVWREIPQGVVAHSVSQRSVNARELGLETMGLFGDGWLWWSEKGPCWGGKEGGFICFADKKLDCRYFGGQQGASVVMKDKVIFTVEP